MADELSPEMMFNKATAPFRSLWAGLRKCLTDCKVQLRVRQHHCTIYKKPNTIFVDDTDNGIAIELAKIIFNGTIYTNSNTNSRPDTNGNEDNRKEKTEHNIPMRLKDAELKFSGDLDE